MKNKGKETRSGEERRRTVRKDVLETFHMFLVIPQVGLRKIYLKDVSEGGLGFYAEPTDSFSSGQVVECFFYINPTLRFPLSFKILHVLPEGENVRLGCEFVDTGTKSYKVFVKFLHLLDELAEFVAT
ncbi:MAG: PilZ domain-containing protein [Bdellovibrionota bacterium]